MTENEKTPQQDQVRVQRGKYDSLNLYEVTEDELTILEKGSPTSDYLNFAIALLSIAASFLITLLTVKIESNRIFCFFTISCIVGFTLGLFLLKLWFRNRNDFKNVIKKIKGRLKTD